MQAGQQGAHEGVAGADGVDHRDVAAGAPQDVATRLLLANTLRDAGELEPALEQYSQAASLHTAETSVELRARVSRALAAGTARIAEEHAAELHRDVEVVKT